MSKKSKTTDPTAFEGEGIRFRAKIIGIEMVPESRGDKMCQEMLQKLKGDVKSTARHKQKVFINITLEGIKIIDGVSLSVLYIHEVTRISFISRDQSDTRAFAYIVGSGDSATPSHTLYAIKTANAAEALVLCLKDLFQTVYEIKKKAIEDAKAKQEAGENEVKPAENGKEGENGGDNQESIYQVPKNNAPVNPQEQEEAVANLLDLEDQVDHILKGIEQIKNLDFENLPSEDAPRAPATSSAAPATIAPPPSSAASSSIADLSDPWGDPSPASVSSAPTSSLADLQALVSGTSTSNPFGMSSFASTAAPNVSMAGSGFGQMGMPFGVPSSQAAPGFGQMGMPFGVPSSQPSGGMPVSQNPFGNSPFAPQQQRPQMPGQSPFGQQPAFGAPFPGGPALAGQPFPGAMGVAPGMQPGFGMVGAPMRGPQPFGMVGAMGMSQGPAPGGVGQGNFFPQQQPEENLLQPLRPGGKEPEPEQTPKKPTQNAMFGDLLDIKKAAPADTSKSPKDLFKDLQQKDKKSLNEIKKEPTVKANSSPFGDPFA